MRPDMSVNFSALPQTGVLVMPSERTATVQTGAMLNRLLDSLCSRQALDTIDYAATRGKPLLVAYGNENGRPDTGLLLQPVKGCHEGLPVASRLAAILVKLLQQGPVSASASLEVAQALRLASSTAPPDSSLAVPVRTLAPWQREQAVAFMDARLANGFTTPDVAAQCGMSSGRFSVAFRMSFGRSIRQWVIQRRIELAQEMLLREDITLEAVATACGFAGQCHFTRQFSRVVGIPPGAWRRRNSVAAA